MIDRVGSGNCSAQILPVGGFFSLSLKCVSKDPAEAKPRRKSCRKNMEKAARDQRAIRERGRRAASRAQQGKQGKLLRPKPAQPGLNAYSKSDRNQPVMPPPSIDNLAPKKLPWFPFPHEHGAYCPNNTGYADPEHFPLSPLPGPQEGEHVVRQGDFLKSAPFAALAAVGTGMLMTYQFLAAIPSALKNGRLAGFVIAPSAALQRFNDPFYREREKEIS